MNWYGLWAAVKLIILYYSVGLQLTVYVALTLSTAEFVAAAARLDVRWADNGRMQSALD